MYDIVIVGAGTAGSVLAERLTASGKLRVLLLEAGGKPASQFVRIPAGFARLFRSKLDWAYESEPLTSAGGRRVFTPRGKMLGGSSNMNAMIHQWCHPADFDGWAEAGATGWNWQDVAPVFRAQERWLGEDGGGVRGREGPMTISPNRHAHALSHHFVAAARASGLSGPPDYNGAAYEGAWMCQIAHQDGRRYSAYHAYLEPAMRRPNLQVRTGAHAVRIGIEHGRAASVTVRRGGVEETHRAGRGIVLCAGSYGTPHLLLLSGIGPASDLQRLGITPVRDAPEVGANLQEHPLVPVVHRTRGTGTLKSAESPLALLRYLLFRSGMLASNAVEAMAFTRLPEAGGAPNFEMLFAPLEWRNQGLEPPRIDAVSCAAILLTPRSRGRVWLKSADPLAAPAIDLGLLNDPEGADAAVMLAGLRLIRKVLATAPLAQFGDGEVFPGAGLDDDRELLARMCTEIQTVYHPTSTCRMGSDAGAIVDPQLRVRGLDGLWIADASVMPAVPRGHPNAVVAMIAGRAADWIQAG